MSVKINSLLFKKHNISGPRYTSYPTAPNFHTGQTITDWQNAMDRSNESEKDLSLYFHIPFCHSLCYFCGCTMKVTRNQDLINNYLSFLNKEIYLVSNKINRNRKVTQIHFGGGSPNFLNPAQIQQLGENISNYFNISENVEFSCEVDPRKFSKQHITVLKDIGVNRISIGVQDFNPIVQKKINRINTIEMINSIVKQLQDSGLESINMDLIYGLPNQTPESFSDTLTQVLSINPSRLAVYNFAYIPRLRPHQKLINKYDLPSPDQKLVMLQMIIEKLTSNGYEFIGMDHFAKIDDDLTIAQKNGSLTRNFQGYSTQKSTDLFAFGISSISQFGDAYFQNYKDFENYYQCLNKNQLAFEKGYSMSTIDKHINTTIMTLMCDMSINYRSISKILEVDFQEYFYVELSQIRDSFEGDGLVKFNSDGFFVTKLGRLYIRNIVMKFDKYLNQKKTVYSKTV
ncbi:MAG: oxygen-independent coproporphyrinogen III oxidase [Candidatus Marinimicrobia bacterium]|nr:oxygen-independent coproporphyrinogen III oxidase [Candidatus Neomarinimicrobiota bacterium]